MILFHQSNAYNCALIIVKFKKCAHQLLEYSQSSSDLVPCGYLFKNFRLFFRRKIVFPQDSCVDMVLYFAQLAVNNNYIDSIKLLKDHWNKYVEI